MLNDLIQLQEERNKALDAFTEKIATLSNAMLALTIIRTQESRALHRMPPTTPTN
jgi:hypothetical protein